MIKHNVNQYGSVQSLGFELDGIDFTAGVCLPGEYNFGPTTREETISITVGYCFINGTAYGPGDRVNIPRGGDVKIHATSAFSYTCQYA